MTGRFLAGTNLGPGKAHREAEALVRPPNMTLHVGAHPPRTVPRIEVRERPRRMAQSRGGRDNLIPHVIESRRLARSLVADGRPVGELALQTSPPSASMRRDSSASPMQSNVDDALGRCRSARAFGSALRVVQPIRTRLGPGGWSGDNHVRRRAKTDVAAIGVLILRDDAEASLSLALGGPTAKGVGLSYRGW